MGNAFHLIDDSEIRNSNGITLSRKTILMFEREAVSLGAPPKKSKREDREHGRCGLEYVEVDELITNDPVAAVVILRENLEIMTRIDDEEFDDYAMKLTSAYCMVYRTTDWCLETDDPAIENALNDIARMMIGIPMQMAINHMKRYPDDDELNLSSPKVFHRVSHAAPQ